MPEQKKCMLSVLEAESELPPNYLVAAFNNLGLIKKSLGMFTEALYYYNKAENILSNGKEDQKDLAFIYNNKSRIYTFQRSFPVAIEYLEKSVRIYQSFENPDKSILQSLSTAYLNLGIIYYESEDYVRALDYLEKSARIKLNNNLSETELTFLNLAKTYARTGNFNQAEEYYAKCLNTIRIKFGDNYFRMSEVYFGYGDFLHKTGRISEALEAYRKALNICLENYGDKHSLVALAYKQLGDFYLDESGYRTALEYYQKSLIAIEPGFNDSDIYSNPPIDSSLLSIRLLEILKNKARALELYGNIQIDRSLKLNIMRSGLGTVDLILQLIDRIRNDYLTEDNRIYLAENEKETYISGVHAAYLLYNLTGESSYGKKMYSIVQRAKAAVLRNDITVKELFHSAGIPDTITDKKNRLASNIAAYNNLVLGELRDSRPDSNKLRQWKDDLFRMHREMESLTDGINRNYPDYLALMQKTDPAPLEEVQKHLCRNETIVEYLISNRYINGKRDLYTFVITKNDLDFLQTGVDSLFSINSAVISNACRDPDNKNYREFTDALEYMYLKLIKPGELFYSGKNLIIIPDEEIALLPFEALLNEKPGPGQTDFEGLPYIINKYSISYCYFSSLIFSNSFQVRKRTEVFSFVPYYDVNNNSGPAPASLTGAATETRSIYRWFRGNIFEGEQATETNFRLAIRKPAVFHLAMHSISDPTDSRYSYLLFDSNNDTLDDGKLYNYEISLSRLTSPMVVLSACNSGTGTLYHGEGLMSLARGFILAGASSVIRTAWEVNDEVSADIISRFYMHLSGGRRKDDALRKAKLEYLKESPPAYSDPYYWAAYEVLGNSAPVRRHPGRILIACLGSIICFWSFIFYLRRRRISSDRSL